MNVLVIDIGGTHVKVLATGQDQKREFVSGPKLTPKQMVRKVGSLVADWKYDVISIGYPGPVLRNRPISEPWNLGKGWLGFNFEGAFQCPVKVINDAAMQGLGSYEGGRMLFLGLGTGLGSAMIVDGVTEPMELGHLPYRKATFEDYVGLRGLEKYGKKSGGDMSPMRWNVSAPRSSPATIPTLSVAAFVCGRTPPGPPARAHAVAGRTPAWPKFASQLLKYECIHQTTPTAGRLEITHRAPPANR